jgi:hypothetical protein
MMRIIRAIFCAVECEKKPPWPDHLYLNVTIGAQHGLQVPVHAQHVLPELHYDFHYLRNRA